MAMIAIAAMQRRKVSTIDITGAYLECEFPEGDEVIMKLESLVAEQLAQLDPTARDYVSERGELTIRLKRALYGCVQSARPLVRAPACGPERDRFLG